MKEVFDDVSLQCSKVATRAYSTSFSLGIYCLDKKFRAPIYSIYGFVRFADEIVDTFHDYDKAQLLDEFERDTYLAIDRGISLNPVLNSFQAVVHQYNITSELIGHFLKSMRNDLHQRAYEQTGYNEYIYGSAEVVGLMCLSVFTDRNKALYEQLKPYARKLGAAFQKVNFLRDLKSDYEQLGRLYFPGITIQDLSTDEKKAIEADIEADFREAIKGIQLLPGGTQFGVYVAYTYYYCLFSKIKSLPFTRIMATRIRVPNYQKIGLLLTSYLRHSLSLL